MIVVDTVVWAAWFNGAESPAVNRLRRALDEDLVGLTSLILTEVLQGLRADSDVDDAEALLRELEVLSLDVDGHAAAARLYRTLRRRGITVRGTIDCLIAQTCVVNGAELLTIDRDFLKIAQVTPLRLCAV